MGLSGDRLGEKNKLFYNETSLKGTSKAFELNNLQKGLPVIWGDLLESYLHRDFIQIESCCS